MAHTEQHAALNWFEIPVADMKRAQAFYERVLAAPLRSENMGGNTLAVFPYADGAVGGCLISGQGYAPSSQGAVVYLNATPNLDAALERAQSAGGHVATPKVQLPGDMGCFAHVIDTEGNRVGLHAQS